MLTNTTPSSARSAAFGGKRRAGVPGSRARLLGLLAVSLAVIGLVAAGVLTGLSPAQAAARSAVAATVPAASASPGPGSTGVASPPPTGSPTAPTIQVSNADRDVTTARGTATPGAKLRVLDPEHPASSLCTVVTGEDGTWSCRVAVSSGADQSLTVRDLTDTALPDVQSPTFSVLTAPVLSTSAGVSVGARVAGTGFPGASVDTTLVDAAAGTRASVSAVVGTNGAWQAILPAKTVPSGTYTASATQSSSKVPDVPVSAASTAISITIDRQAPAPPVILHPVAGSTVSKQPLVFDGTGEEGDTVTTYVDSNPVCTAVVKKSKWSCRSTGLLIPAGTRTVQAAQRDAAGNYGAPTAGSAVVFAVTTATSPSATPSPSTSAQPTHPQATPSPSASSAAPAAPGSGSTPGSGGSSGTDGSGAGGGSQPGTGSGAGAGSSGAGTIPGGASSVAAASSWTGPTGFGHNLPSLSEGLGGWSWAWALGLGLLVVLLVLAPLRLAATALGGRLAVRAAQFTGRNRARAGTPESPLLSPAVATALTLVGGAVLVALAAGVDDQLRYVRLVVAIIIGLGIINGLGVALPTFLAGRRLGLRLRLRVSPRLLAAAALACLATRLFDLDPPMVLGVLLTAGLIDGTGHDLDETGDVQRGGILATVQLGSLAVVSFAAWIAHGLLPASTQFAGEITRETLATICLAGLGSLIVLLVPLGRLPGRALLSWSRPTLVGLVVVGVAMAAVVYAGDPDEGFPVVPLLVAALAFAVVALSTWVWVRYVEPTVDDFV